MRGEHTLRNKRSCFCLDHPRMRGEHTNFHYRGIHDRGSSPHARGAPRVLRRRSRRDRIIPACAGSTPGVKVYCTSFTDHPRMRGEHHRAAGYPSATAGSSPHARGAHVIPAPRVHIRGIIPACAGSTRIPRSARGPSADHPRMRGEHHRRSARGAGFRGSSPHARGAQHHRTSECQLSGIIPACAGSTSRHPNGRSHSRDHPRMRGEHSR